MALRLISPASFRRMPWKNGGGETIEILASPDGADLGGFDWRVSMAKVAADGPFSRFEGIDRTLTVLEGGRLGLAFDDRIVELDPASPPFPFAGDEACNGSVPDGPIVDLNVMTRRGRCRHHVTRLAGSEAREAAAPTMLCLATKGSGHIEVAGKATALPEGYAALVEGGGPLRLIADPGATLFLIEIAPA